MELFYQKMNLNQLLKTLKENKKVRESLIYMITFKKIKKLKVLPKKHSIEIFNDEISVSILLYVGFELEEYNELKLKTNYHIVSFNRYNKLIEFKEFESEIKYINLYSWFYTILSFSKNKFCTDLKIIRDFNLN